MKQTIYIFIFTIVSCFSWSQELHIAADTDATIKPSGHMYTGKNVAIIGTLAVESNATKSGSFIAANGTVGGDITYKRYINTTGTSWNLAAPPVKTQAVQPFVTNNDNGIRVDPQTNNYAVAIYKNTNIDGEKWVYQNDSPTGNTQVTLTDFVNGQGYRTGRSGAGIYTFTGTMATSDVIKEIGGGGSNWTCLRNPYPSFISASSLYIANKDILHTNSKGIYLWNPEGNSGSGKWEILNKSSPDQQLHPGQAFFVRSITGATTATTQDFIFTESLQEVEETTTNDMLINTSVQSIDLNLSNGTITSSTTLKYFPNTTTGLDIGWDASSFNTDIQNFSVDTHLVADSQDVNFAIQCLSDSEYETSVVPLSVKVAANEEITFSAIANNLPSGMNVYLEDKINNTIEKINDNASYTITTTNPIDGIGRFYLHTSSTSLSINTLSPQLNSLNIYKTSNRNLKIIGLERQGIASLKIYNIIGQEIFTHVFTMQPEYDAALPILKTGVYFVQIASEKRKHTKKIIIE